MLNLNIIRTLRALVALVLMGFLLPACVPTPTSVSDGPFYPGIQVNLEKATQDSVLECNIPGGCPQTVGLIIFDKGGWDPEIGQCSGTLISQDTVLTNSHCIPDSVKLSPNHCSDKIKFVQIGSGAKKVFSCTQLIHASNIDGKGKSSEMAPDYALFRIESTGIRGVEIQRSGINDGEALHAFTVNPIKRKVVAGSIVKKTFNTVMHSIFASDYSSPYAQVVTLRSAQHQAVPGNSGSGILNSAGKLVGVLSHTIYKEKYEEAMPNVRGLYALSANLSCLDLQSFGPPIPNECNDPKEVKTQTEIQLENEVKVLVDRFTPNFNYDFHVLNTSTPTEGRIDVTYQTIPKCYHQIGPVKTEILETTLPVEFDHLVLHVLVTGVDEYSRPELTVTHKPYFKSEGTGKWEIDGVRVSAEIMNTNGTKTMAETKAPFCSEAELQDSRFEFISPKSKKKKKGRPISITDISSPLTSFSVK